MEDFTVRHFECGDGHLRTRPRSLVDTHVVKFYEIMLAPLKVIAVTSIWWHPNGWPDSHKNSRWLPVGHFECDDAHLQTHPRSVVYTHVIKVLWHYGRRFKSYPSDKHKIKMATSRPFWMWRRPLSNSSKVFGIYTCDKSFMKLCNTL